VGLWLGLTLLTNPVQGIGCINVNSLDPVLNSAFGGTPNYVTPTGTHVYYEQLGGANSGIYFATDTIYNVIFAWTGEGVILVDCPGAWTKATIEKVIPTKNTVTHYIYSHTHQDHNNCGNLYTNATFIGHIDSQTHLIAKNDPTRPVPTVTFTQNYTLSVGTKTFFLTIMKSNPNHLPGNIAITATSTTSTANYRALMFVDVVFPGWVPFLRFGEAQDFDSYLAVHDELSAMTFDQLIGGHIGKLGTQSDVTTSKNYYLSVKDACAAGDQAVSIGAVIGQALNQTSGNAWWAILKGYYKSAQVCEQIVIKKWSGILAGVDVYALDHCLSLGEHLRLD